MVRRLYKIFEQLIDRYYLKESEYQSRQRMRMDLISKGIEEWEKEGREIVELIPKIVKR